MSEQFPTTAELIAKHELRDRIAAAIYSKVSGWDGFPFDDLTDTFKAIFLEQADAVIEALGLHRVDDTNRTHFQYVTDWQEFGTDE